MASLAEEDVSFAELATVIERDSVLSGNVLRLVNSALYGRRGTISSIRAAVSILGMNKLRNFLLGLSVSSLWAKVKTPPDWSMRRFNTHSVATAILSDSIVQKARTDYPEGAFAAGLLHDLGRLVIASAMPHDFHRIAALRQQTGRPLPECEQELFGFTHPELSSAALTRWALPGAIQRAVLHHHTPQLDGDHANTGVHPLSRILAASDEIADSLGHVVDPEDEHSARAPGIVLSELGLCACEEAILASFLVEMQALQSTF
ncbi:MAG: HDOD domain-containing protein [Acidobacteria bacterium]|nr:HDOD domain-containing protein [Acidobacteriota bacterium]